MSVIFTVRKDRTVDSTVRARLLQWPQRPPGLPPRESKPDTWLRGRPANLKGLCHPFLKLPGSVRLRTLPDGLWLNFGGSPVEPYVDIFAIEACGTLQNLLDKRSRFAASTSSLMAVCPLPWLLQAVSAEDPMPRWKMTGLMHQVPTQHWFLPVRDVRVVYGLKHRHYHGFTTSQIPQAHEYFVPMEALLAENSDKNPAMQALVARANASANFFDG